MCVQGIYPVTYCPSPTQLGLVECLGSIFQVPNLLDLSEKNTRLVPTFRTDTWPLRKNIVPVVLNWTSRIQLEYFIPISPYTIWFWVNYNISLTWNVVPFWDDSPKKSPWFQGSVAVRSLKFIPIWLVWFLLLFPCMSHEVNISQLVSRISQSQYLINIHSLLWKITILSIFNG